MTKIHRIASAAAILFGIGALTQGCLVTCEEQEAEDGSTKTVCTGESLTRYNGSDDSRTLSYSDGLNLAVTGINGGIDVQSGSGDDVVVTFKPFTMRPDGESDQAKVEMEDNLVLTATDDGSITVSVSKASGSSSTLGADIVVTLPSSFNGAVVVDQNNGSTDVSLGGASPSSVDIRSDNGSVDLSMSGDTSSATTVHTDNGSLDLSGVHGELNITQGNGVDCNVSVSAWSTEDGNITCDSLGSNISIASGLSGSVQVVSGGVITDSVGSDWVASDANTSNSAAWSFGDDPSSFGTVLIEDSGDINLSSN